MTTITRFYVCHCTFCASTVLLSYAYEKLGYNFSDWEDVNAALTCCSTPHVYYDTSIDLEDVSQLEDPPLIPMTDRITLVLEDLQEEL